MINLLIVEDSSFMRNSLKKWLSNKEEILVKHVARNGIEALNIISSFNDIDVIILDLFMPKMDGIETLKNIMEDKPTPTLIFTTADENTDGELLLDALKLGAVDIVQKPSSMASVNLKEVMDDLERKIIAAYNSRDRLKVFINSAEIRKHFKNGSPTDLSKLTSRKIKDIEKEHPKESQPIFQIDNVDQTNLSRIKLIIIGASTGGPPQIIDIVKNLRYSPKIAVIVVQHIPQGFTESFARRLNQKSTFTVVEATHEGKLQNGFVYIVPGDFHLKLMKVNEDIYFQLNQEEKVWGVRPCIDYVFVTAAQILKWKVLGIILTGMGRDGTFGARIIKEYGGITIAQDPDEALIESMPLVAIKNGYIDYVLGRQQIAHIINKEIIRY